MLKRTICFQLGHYLFHSFGIPLVTVNSTYGKQSNVITEHINENNKCLLSFDRLPKVDNLRP